MSLAPRERKVVRFSIEVVGARRAGPVGRGRLHRPPRTDLRRDYERWFAGATDIFTDSEQVIPGAASRPGRPAHAHRRPPIGADLRGRPCPWFVAPFGRDMIIASLETLMLDTQALPADDRALLTRLQGKVDNVFREEEPGKIIHEIRQGEFANLKAIPHTPYFGAIDTTPLYLLLLCEVVMWNGDLEFFESLREPIEAALAWIDTCGDLDGDGFVEYRRRSRGGLANQGWRDAHNAIVHADGRPAEGPIALADVQGYVYHAKRRLATLFGQLGDVELSSACRRSRKSSSGASTSASGWRTRVRGDGAGRRQAASEDGRLDVPATACGRGSSPRSWCRRSCAGSWRPTCSRAGACAQWPSRRWATAR